MSSEHDNKCTNIIKIRDDSEYLAFEQIENSDKFSITNNKQGPSWLSNGNNNGISLSNLRSGVEPWLTSLFQSEHLSLLTGTGLSIAAQYLATNSANNAMGEPNISTKYADQVKAFANTIAIKNGRGKANIEDYIRTMNELLRGFEVMGYHLAGGTDKNRSDYNILKNDLETIITNFTNDISNIESSIVSADKTIREEMFTYLVNFLMSFASRTGTRERLNIFTTNYDRIIEVGSELAGLHLIDRFVGILSPIFRSSRLDIDMHYNPPGIRGEPRYLEGVVRFTKLHGSIDWIDTGTDVRRIGLPFGSKDIANFLNAPGFEDAANRKIMIYPNSAKDRETAEYPYVELFRDFAAALCRPNSTLVTYGYGFGDDHINRVIRDMLTIPSTHLVIISYDNANGRIMKKYKEFGRSSQISLIIGNKFADLKTLVDFFLPKPSIDRASFRMGELLKQRYSITQSNITPDKYLTDEGDSSSW